MYVLKIEPAGFLDMTVGQKEESVTKAFGVSS